MSVQPCDLQPLLAHTVPGQANADSSEFIDGGLPSVSHKSPETEARDGLIQSLVQALTLSLIHI